MAQFGGPSFGPQTIEMMSKALEGCRGFLARAGIGPAASIDRRDDLEGGRRRRARSGPPEGRGDVCRDVCLGFGCRQCGRTAAVDLTANAAKGTGPQSYWPGMRLIGQVICHSSGWQAISCKL